MDVPVNIKIKLKSNATEILTHVKNERQAIMFYKDGIY